MKRSPHGSPVDDDLTPQQQQPPYYYLQQQQQQQDIHYQQHISYQSVSAKTFPASSSSFSYPLHAPPPPAASPDVMLTATPPVSDGTPLGDDDMDHWLVDICAELGTNDEGPQTASRPHPPQQHQQQQQQDASYTTSSSSAAAPVVPVIPVVPPLQHPQLTPLAVPPLSMRYIAPFPAEYAQYTAMSSSSSPGSSSVDSGGEATLPHALVYPTTATPPAAVAVAGVIGTGTTARRARSKKKATMTKAPRQQTQEEAGVGGEEEDEDGSEAHSTTAEARREKNRLRVRRHYYRKLSQMNDLRAQVSELEEKIQSMRLSPSHGTLLLSAGTVSGDGEGPLVLSPQQQQMQQFLQQLEDAKRVLEQENQQVREVLYQQTRQFMLTRQHLVDESKFLTTPFPMPFIVKKRLAPAECDCIWQKTENELSGLVCHRAPTASFNDGSDSICGWKTTRAVEDGAFKFVFQKMFFNCPAEQTMDASWAVFKNPKGFAKLYSPTVNMWCSLVQVVDDDNVVLFQEHRSMDKDEVHVMMKTIMLVSRVKRAASLTATNQADYSITLRGLEHEQLMLEDLSVSQREGYEVWNDINCWLQWIPRGENNEHCECKVSGAIPTVGSNSYFWMVEVLLIVMRLEATTAGPSLFSVPCK